MAHSPTYEMTLTEESLIEEAHWRDMERAAEAGDAALFMRAASEIDWEKRNAAETAQAVRWALAAGAHLLARELAAEGAKRHPDDEDLAKLARILAPPKFLGTSPASPSTKANIKWLREHAEEHRGNWIALKNGRLVARGKDVKALRQQVGDLKGYMITKVW